MAQICTGWAKRKTRRRFLYWISLGSFLASLIFFSSWKLELWSHSFFLIAYFFWSIYCRYPQNGSHPWSVHNKCWKNWLSYNFSFHLHLGDVTIFSNSQVFRMKFLGCFSEYWRRLATVSSVLIFLLIFFAQREICLVIWTSFFFQYWKYFQKIWNNKLRVLVGV